MHLNKEDFDGFTQNEFNEFKINITPVIEKWFRDKKINASINCFYLKGCYISLELICEGEYYAVCFEEKPCKGLWYKVGSGKSEGFEGLEQALKGIFCDIKKMTIIEYFEEHNIEVYCGFVYLSDDNFKIKIYTYNTCDYFTLTGSLGGAVCIDYKDKSFKECLDLEEALKMIVNYVKGDV